MSTDNEIKKEGTPVYPAQATKNDNGIQDIQSSSFDDKLSHNQTNVNGV